MPSLSLHWNTYFIFNIAIPSNICILFSVCKNKQFVRIIRQPKKNSAVLLSISQFFINRWIIVLLHNIKFESKSRIFAFSLLLELFFKLKLLPERFSSFILELLDIDYNILVALCKFILESNKYSFLITIYLYVKKSSNDSIGISDKSFLLRSNVCILSNIIKCFKSFVISNELNLLFDKFNFFKTILPSFIFLNIFIVTSTFNLQSVIVKDVNLDATTRCASVISKSYCH